MNVTPSTIDRPTGNRFPLSPTGKSEWRSVSKENPCRVCGHDHNCKEAINGTAAYCSRVPSNYRQNAGGQYWHRLDPAWRPSPQATPSTSATANTATGQKQPAKPKSDPKPKSELPSFDWYLHQSQHPQHAAGLEYWHVRWDVPIPSILSTGAIAYPDEIHIPERQPGKLNQVSTLVTRSRDGRLRWLGSSGRNRGVTLVGDLRGNRLALLVLEGASCVIAADAAGFDAIGRSTRNADLEQYAGTLANVPADYPVFVTVENDERKNTDLSEEGWIEHLKSEACKKAQTLADISGRPIYVNSFVREFNGKPINDFADRYRAEADGRGRYMADAERYEIGEHILAELMDGAIEVLPSEESINEYRKAEVAALEERILCEAELARHEANTEDFDQDYDTEDSCQFYKSFNRRTKQDDGTDYLFVALGCKSWGCTACRNRKLKPDWKIHLAKVTSTADEIFRKTIVSDSIAVQRRKLEAIRKRISRQKGQYLSLQISETEAVIYSTIPMKGLCEHYRCRSHRDDFDAMLERICLDVSRIEVHAGKPINTSRAWARGEKVEIEHVEFKISRIAETTAERNEILYSTELSPDVADEVLKAASRKNRHYLDRDARPEFFAVKLPDRVVVMSTHPLDATSRQATPGDAAGCLTSALHAMYAPSDENWRELFRTTPKWTPKPTKEWRPLEIEVSPQVASTAAKQVGALPRELDYMATESFNAGVLVRFKDHGTNEDTFIELLTTQQTAKCPCFPIYKDRYLGNHGQIDVSSRNLREIYPQTSLAFSDPAPVPIPTTISTPTTSRYAS